MRYVALLRGINVGGNNIIKMFALNACFVRLGFDDVMTYIQSGNVLFSSPEKNADLLSRRIQKAILKTFNVSALVIVISREKLSAIVAHAPHGFGTSPGKYRYDVVFLNRTLSAKRALTEIQTKEGVDEAHAGRDVIYFSRLIAKATQSRLSRITQRPVYKEMTIRNWNTTIKLLALLDKNIGR